MFGNGIRISTILEKCPNLKINCYTQQLQISEFAEKIKKNKQEIEKKEIEDRNRSLEIILEELKQNRDILKKSQAKIKEEGIELSKELKNIREIKNNKMKKKEEIEKLKLNHLRR